MRNVYNFHEIAAILQMQAVQHSYLILKFIQERIAIYFQEQTSNLSNLMNTNRLKKWNTKVEILKRLSRIQHSHQAISFLYPAQNILIPAMNKSKNRKKKSVRKTNKTRDSHHLEALKIIKKKNNSTKYRNHNYSVNRTNKNRHAN